MLIWPINTTARQWGWETMWLNSHQEVMIELVLAKKVNFLSDPMKPFFYEYHKIDILIQPVRLSHIGRNLGCGLMIFFHR